MIDKIFQTAVFGAIATTMALSSPAMAGESFMRANMLKYNTGSTERWVMDGCAGSCEDHVAIVSYGGGKPFAKASFNAAKRLHEEGVPVVYVMARDTNDNELDALTITYIDGKPSREVTLDAGYAVIDEGMVKVKDIEGSVYNQARDTYKEFLASRSLAVR